MRYRVAFAVAFVALVGGLIALRDHGFIGGRQLGGPLELVAADGSRVTKRTRPARFRITGTLDVRAVRVQNVRPRAVSPELELDATAGGRPLEDATLSPADPGSAPDLAPIRVTLRAQRAGLYYALGLIVDYRRGQRRFRDRESQLLCIAVQTKQQCDPSYGGPGDARVAQVGGPSRYPRSELSMTEAAYTKPGDYRLRVTVANQTRSAIAVSSIAFDGNDLGVELTSSAPESFRLPPHGYRVVRLRARLPECRPSSVTFTRLRAKLDGERRSIPLSLPLEFGCGR
jgi:hypothetical protein